MTSPRRFYLHRTDDPTGVSGTGHVADGILWPDGTANVRWRGEHPSAVFWDQGQASVELIHGHGGATRIVWLDTQPDAELHDALAAAAHTVLEGTGPRTVDEWATLVADAVLPAVQSRLAQTERERNGAYRERNALAALAASQAESAVVAPATDVDEPGWQILYLVLHGRQCSWHFGHQDADLIEHLEHVPDDDPRAQWDHHTTEAKYEHIAWIARALGTPGPFRKAGTAEATEGPTR